MARELFIPHRFQAHTRALVDHANTIIAEYQAQGFRLTLRQLFYQFVSRDLLANTQNQYRLLQRTLVNGRNAGEIDWDGIEDRERVMQRWSWFRNPAGLLEAAARSYGEDMWAGQEYRPEVWIEKEALVGVIESICREYRVPYLAHKGGNSASAMYEAGKRFAKIISQGQIPLVLHLADHDPTGVFMSEDTEKRLALYAGSGGASLFGQLNARLNALARELRCQHVGGDDPEVRRIALTMEQVEEHQPPPNFVKEEDARTPAYIQRFDTEECWELDALSPTVISDLIRRELDDLIDQDKWQAAQRKEERNRKLIAKVAANWPMVMKQLKGKRR
jgi:hypothetical protein